LQKVIAMSDIRNFRDLEAWQVSMAFVDDVYSITLSFPKVELYGLAGQLRRAAVSIPSNIAEGQARGGRAGLNHLSIALGSLAETETQIEIALRRGYLSATRMNNLRPRIESCRRLLYGLRRAKRLRLGLSVGGPVILIALQLLA